MADKYQALFLPEEEISIPSESIKYIEDRLEGSLGEPYKFEIIELFFEWLFLQSRATQHKVLKGIFENGRFRPNLFANLKYKRQAS